VENLKQNHSNGEKTLYSLRRLVKKEKKTVRLSFGKKEKSLQDPPKTAENAAGEYFMYKKLSLKWLKTQWKKWKTPWETPLLFHKCGGKPGGKSG